MPFDCNPLNSGEGRLCRPLRSTNRRVAKSYRQLRGIMSIDIERADGIEVVQVTQKADNSLPLIWSKTTIARERGCRG